MDLGSTDPLNMGAAMAPAAADTILRYFQDTGWEPNAFDLILTGDLGQIGLELCRQELSEQGLNLGDNFMDCGLMIYDREKPDVHAGGSGCACSAVVTYGHIYRRFKQKELQRVLLVATGSLHSPTTYQQGENIPSIAHAIRIEA